MVAAIDDLAVICDLARALPISCVRWILAIALQDTYSQVALKALLGQLLCGTHRNRNLFLPASRRQLRTVHIRSFWL